MTTPAALRRLQADIRQRLQSHGTDVELNDSDPTGDGDQSPIHLNHDGKQVYRNLFAEGGDICTSVPTFSSFSLACVAGNTSHVEKSIKEADENAAKPSDSLIQLLETRETSMRLPPLLLLVALGKGVLPQTADLSQRQVLVARMLLKYGARPDAKDVCGKTVCHYGAGMMATNMTMEVVTMCIEAAESCHVFGQEVELFGLKNENMNGKRGVGRGFDAVTGRRAVYLFDDKKQVALKPANIRLCNESDTPIRPRLCDVQDRLGMVCLTEVFMTSRDDVAKFLLDKHRARLDVADWDGYSPQSMAVRPGADLSSSVAKFVKRKVTEDGLAKMKTEKGRCSQCGSLETADTPLLVCSRCRSAQYCSKDCQTKHWKEGGHKEACRIASEKRKETVILEKPRKPSEGGEGPITVKSFCSSFTGSITDNGEYRNPDYVAPGEPFYIKIQYNIPGRPLLIYDKSRQCQFCYCDGQRGYAELCAKVKEEKAFGGKKTYLQASFDESGNCTVYLGTATLKKW